ncbi:MAG: prolyl-tRNA synthetase associated domain-containing protein [Hyphomicrobium sp.]
MTDAAPLTQIHPPVTPQLVGQSAVKPFGRTELLDHLAAKGMKTTTVEHPAVHTVAESSVIDINVPGAHTKNLFLKDEDGRLLLVVAKSSTKVDLKLIAKALGTARLSFGKPELMMAVLGVTPGSVTAFAIINDVKRQVRVIMDNELMAHDSVNCHPLENTATTNIALDDLLRFIRETGHEPEGLTVGTPSSLET